MIFLDIPQGGEAWTRWRMQGIGASEAAMVMGVSPWGDALTLWKRKLGLEPEEVSTFAMRRGLRLEPTIRGWYAQTKGVDSRPCVVASETLPWMRASLDGLDPWGEIVLEIKAPNEDAHRLALAGDVPDYYWPQVQHQLAVVDTARVCHYLSYSEKASVADGDRFALVVVERDEAYIAKLIEREAWFWDCLQRRVEPVEVAA